MTPYAILALALVACAHAQYDDDRAQRFVDADKPKPTPVPILKQINRHNEDGSYTYGYEAADGSFKIETKAPTGEVKGKYGYKDDSGKLRVVEYGANKYGFQPAGDGITVAPPTLVDETKEGREREEQRAGKSQPGRRPQAQAVDYDYEEPAPPPRAVPRPSPAFSYTQQQPQPQQQEQQQYRPAPQQQQYRPAPQQQQFRPASQGPAPPKPAFFSGAAPSPIEDNNSFFNPAPARPKPKQDFRPSPQFQFPSKTQIEYSQDFSQAPARQQQYSSNNNSPTNFNQERNHQPYSMLDQLLKEYSLPENGANPLHDISFGSF